MKISTDDMRDFLRQRQVKYEERPIEYGTQFRCRNGEVFNVYDSGTCVPRVDKGQAGCG